MLEFIYQSKCNYMLTIDILHIDSAYCLLTYGTLT